VLPVTRPPRHDEAEAAYRVAAAAGARGALRDLADHLRHHSRREAEVEAIYRESAAAGERGAQEALAEWLCDQPDRRAEADRIDRSGLDGSG
jgi:hypothetical protein